MNQLVTFETNDLQRLFELTRKVHSGLDFFRIFLNENQYKLLSFIIATNNLKVWDNFLEGNLFLKLQNGLEGQDIEDFEEGAKFAKRLALHIRYLLWEKAIDYYYRNQDEADDFALLESLDAPDPREPGQSGENGPSNGLAAPSGDNVVREEEDDYDDEEEETSQAPETTEAPMDVEEEVVYNENNQVVLEIPVETFKKEEQEEDESEAANTKDQEALIKEFNKIYHNFEYDRETLIKRRKLEKSDLRLEKTADENVAKPDEITDKKDTSVEFQFVTGSSLKHLLGTIQSKREEIPLNDYELRTLFMDVKKNRGKWANDERIGQEELYEACEKVVLELRSYTEHSTPFLNKVSKREAPNYGLIIKTPMDLNTVMKKLKNLQYNSKQEFVDDIMLIWSNCLLFNSDPKHFLRVHAIAMQKKALKLVPHIPNIVIKNRADLEKDDEKEDIETGKGKASKKGRKRTRTDDVKVATPSEEPQEEVEPQEEADEEEEEAEEEAATVVKENEGETATVEEPTAVEEEEEEEDDELNDENRNEEDEIGPELQAWRTLTAKSRANYCSARAELFSSSYKLNFDAPAILREPNEMSNFNDYISNTQVVSKGNLLENDDPYLLEYDITGGLPGINYRGVDDEEQEKLEQKIVDSLIQSDIQQQPSGFVLSTEKGLNSIYFENIGEMQEIRKICFKISLIRQMQTQQFVHHTQMRQPEVDKLKEVDVDPVSKLENHEPFSKEVQYSTLRKNVSKIVMQTGFETAQPSALNTLTQLAERYMSNLVKSIKIHHESASKNKLTGRERLLVALIENGVNKPDDLYTFINERVLNQQIKLKDLRTKLQNFLKDLLRPGLENFNEKSFRDDSEQFITGDFSNDLGDDFFGFKELGLDKENDLLSSSIPIYLLHSRLHTSYTTNGVTNKINKYDDLKDYQVAKLYGSDVDSQIGLLKTFYQSLLEKTTAHYIKQQKKNGLSTELPELSKFPLVDDEELPQKQRNIRPRLPPTGKITVIKKRPVASSFYLPEETEEVKEEANGDYPFDEEMDAKELELMMAD